MNYKKTILIIICAFLTIFYGCASTNTQEPELPKTKENELQEKRETKFPEIKESKFPVFNEHVRIYQVENNLLLFILIESGLIGWYNNLGEEIIPFKPGYISVFENEYCLVHRDIVDNKYVNSEIIKTDGTLVKKLKYKFHDYIGSSTHPPLYMVTANGKFGIYNHKGELVSIPEFEEIYPINANGLIGVKKNGKWGFLNMQGQMTIEPEYDEVHPFFNDSAVVKKNGKAGMINKNNEIIIPFIYDDISRSHYRDLDFYIYKQKFTISGIDYLRGGLIDKEGNILVEAKETGYNVVALFKNGYMISENDEQGYISYDKNVQISPKLGYAYIYETQYPNRFIVFNNKGFAVIDEQNNEIIPFMSMEIEEFGEDFVCQGNNKFLIFDKDGTLKQRGNYTFLGKLVDETFRIGVFDKTKGIYRNGVLNKDGEVILEPLYDYVLPISKNFRKVMLGNYYGILNNDGEVVVPIEYDSITIYQNTPKETYRALLKKGKKSYIIDEEVNID